MRLPNGYGSVYKLSGNRRNPWIVRKTREVIIDKENNKAKQLYDIIGYYETKAKALQALAKYNEDPYDLHAGNITFAEVYDKWSEEYFSTFTSNSSVRTITSAYNHCKPLYGLKMREIRVEHLEQVIKNAPTGSSSKARIKSMLNFMYKYAMKHEIVDKDYAQLCDPVKAEKPLKEKIPFTEKEIQILWDNVNIPFVDMILIGIYSGWRPQELAILQTNDINLDDATMFGGLKTKAGKNRYVPIHPLIMPLIKNRYNKEKPYLFADEDYGLEHSMTYDKYRHRFNGIMEVLRMKHRPHETRHTFITLAKKFNMDEYILKLIVGHTITDITEKIYTHRTMEQLHEEIIKIK